MTNTNFTDRLDGRLHEWVMTVAMIHFGLAMLVWPKMSNGSIIHLLALVLSSTQIALVFLGIGGASLLALVANGASYRIGPRVRSICAIARASLWTEFTLAMLGVSIEQGFPSPMVFFWGTFTVAEIYVAYRAALDVRNP